MLTKADGTKFGKTEGGTVWLDPELTSPYAFHQFWLNAEDAKVMDYLKIFSCRSHDELAELAEQTEQAPYKRLAQRALADDVTDLVHGVEARKAADEAARALFGRGELAALDDATISAVMGRSRQPRSPPGTASCRRSWMHWRPAVWSPQSRLRAGRSRKAAPTSTMRR